MREHNILISFLKKNQLLLTSLILAFLSLHLALTDKKEEARGSLTDDILSIALSPLQRVMLGTHDAVTGVWSDYIYLVQARKENLSLKLTIAAMNEENNRLKEEVNLNSRLKEVLEYREGAGFKTTSASVTGYHTDRWTRTITINKGGEDGIRKDLAVITPLGVLGMVMEVNGHTSRVLLDTDIRSNIDAIVQRTRVMGVVEGGGGGGLVLKYIQQADDVRIGDLLLTSGLTGIFPKGLVIGEVSKIEQSPDSSFKHIEVRPGTDINNVEEILVVADTGLSSE
ncbi:MAG: rod shape-determining protein MreC [Deltaproteobacteria bacterium]